MESATELIGALAMPKSSKIYHLIPNSNQFHDVVIKLLEHLTNDLGLQGMMISATHSADSWVKLLATHHVSTSKLFIIEATGSQVKSIFSNSIHVSHPSSLVELSMSITAAIRQGHYDFLVFDDYGMIYRHTSAESANRFAEYITSKIKLHNMKGFFICINEPGAEAANTMLKKLADKSFSF